MKAGLYGDREACGIGSAAMCAELGSRSSALGYNAWGLGPSNVSKWNWVLGSMAHGLRAQIGGVKRGSHSWKKVAPILQLKLPLYKFENAK